MLASYMFRPRTSIRSRKAAIDSAFVYITDLVLLVLRILRQDLRELVDSIVIIKFISLGGTKPRGH